MIDKIIIGAGLYGLYAALYCARRGQSVVVLEMEKEAFSRATFANQARVHMGYHYPRSLSTAMKSAGYFKRFVEDYGCCIHSEFDQVYATSSHFHGQMPKNLRNSAGMQIFRVKTCRWTAISKRMSATGLF